MALLGSPQMRQSITVPQSAKNVARLSSVTCRHSAGTHTRTRTHARTHAHTQQQQQQQHCCQINNLRMLPHNFLLPPVAPTHRLAP
jgi:hypothetical protein